MTSPDRGRPRYTVMLIPDGGRGAVRQVEVHDTHLWRGAAGAAALVVCALVGLVTLLGVGPGWGAGRLAQENLALRARLQALEQTVAAAEVELEQVRLQQAQLAAISGGYGPLDTDEAGLIGATDAPGRATWPGEDGAPLDELDVDGVDQRARRLLDTLRRTGPELERLIAAEWARRETVPRSWPTLGVLTSGFGMRRSPITHTWKFHQGLDIGAARGTPVGAAAAGEVVRAEYTSGYGNLVEIDHGGGIVTRYGHNSRLLVEEGDAVLRGDVIATVGSTGQSTGPHLHYEVHIDGEPVDPLEYIED